MLLFALRGGSMRAFWLLALVVPSLLFAAESDYQGREEIEKLMATPEMQIQEHVTCQ